MLPSWNNTPTCAATHALMQMFDDRVKQAAQQVAPALLSRAQSLHNRCIQQHVKICWTSLHRGRAATGAVRNGRAAGVAMFEAASSVLITDMQPRSPHPKPDRPTYSDQSAGLCNSDGH